MYMNFFKDANKDSIMENQHSRSFPKRIASLAVTLIIVVLIFSRADLTVLKGIVINTRYIYLFLALALLGTHFLLAGWRWAIISRLHCSISILESVRFIIACSPLNLIFPAKAGSFAKAFFMKEEGYLELKPAVSMAFYEKFSDIAALSFIFICSFLLTPVANILTVTVLAVVSFFLILYLAIHITNLNIFIARTILAKNQKIKVLKILYNALNTIFDYIVQVKKQKKRLLMINLISIIIWANSILQFVFFFKMFRLQVPVSAIFLNITCAIFIGILPISICGIGTRDAAIIYLFRGILSYNEAVSIGIVSTLRYIFPALIGLPFFNILMFKRKINFSLRQNMEKC